MNTLTLNKLFIGDSVEKSASFADYPASLWDLKYEIDSVSLAFSKDGDTFTLQTPMSGLDSGTYQYRLLLANIETPTLKKTLLSGMVTIVDLEYRSHARKVLDSIEATIEGRASQAQSEMTINGRAIKYYAPEQLLKLRSTYQREVANEIAQDRMNAGLGSRNKILVRF